MSDVLSHLSATEASAFQMPLPLICQHAPCVSAIICCVVSQYIEERESEKEKSSKTTVSHSDSEMKYQPRPVKRT